MSQKKSGFILAGGETLNSICDRYLKSEGEDYITREGINSMLNKSISGVLHSFGEAFEKRRNINTHIKSHRKIFQSMIDTKILDGINIFCDSGGFQASIGRLEKESTDDLIQAYHKFLREEHNLIDRAFVLDLPPGPGCKIFHSFEEIYEKNLETYKMASEFPDEIRSKMIYIHHFRTPKLWNIFNRILFENDLFEKFSHFATGGIVANTKGDSNIPCIIYVLPLIPLLIQCKKRNIKKLDFHILGGATFRDLFFYEILEKHIKEVHDIQVNFTFDSSSLFKGLMIGRFIVIIEEDGTFRKLDLRSSLLDLRFKGKETHRTTYLKHLNKMAQKYNFKPLNLTEPYSKETGTFFPIFSVYTMLFMLDQFSECQTMFSKSATNFYELYKMDKIEELNFETNEITKKINKGNITRKQTAKNFGLINSLKIITELNYDYCEYIVNKCLSKDEFINLSDRKKILTF